MRGRGRGLGSRSACVCSWDALEGCGVGFSFRSLEFDVLTSFCRIILFLASHLLSSSAILLFLLPHPKVKAPFFASLLQNVPIFHKLNATQTTFKTLNTTPNTILNTPP